MAGSETSLLSAAGAFLFVLCLAAFGAYGVSSMMKGRRFGFLNRKRAPKYERVSVLETVSLGQKRYLAVVEAGGELHLLGLGPAQVNYLTKLPSKTPLEKEAVREETGGSQTSPHPRLRDRLVEPSIPVADAGSFQSHYEQLRARLNRK